MTRAEKMNLRCLMVDPTFRILTQRKIQRDQCALTQTAVNVHSASVYRYDLSTQGQTHKGHGAVTIGSEISGGVDDIQIKNCVFYHTDRGLRVKTRRGRGKDSVLQGIVFDNIRMEHVRSAFVINSFYYCGPDGKTEYVSSKAPLPVDDRTPSVKDVHIRNVECADTHVAGVYFYGLPEQKIEQVEMENVHITYAENAESGTAAMMQGCERTCGRRSKGQRDAD